MKPTRTWLSWLLPVLALAAGCGPSEPASTPVLGVSPASLAFSALPGGGDPSPQVLTAMNLGQGILAAPTASIRYATGAGWLAATVTGSSAPYTVSVQPSVGSLAPGTHSATVEVTSSGASSSPWSVPVTFVVAAAPARSLSGTVTYDKVPPYANSKAGPYGLDYAHTTRMPVRGVRVELRDAASGTVVASGVTDDLGHYRLPWSAEGVDAVILRIHAATVTPMIRVQDNTKGYLPWVADSAPIESDSGATLDLNMGSGWDARTASYAGPRAAGPFAVLDTAYAAAQKFLAERAVDFPDLAINWSPQNRPEGAFSEEDYAAGRITTSHYDPSKGALFILGKADVDTDEYDSHIIAHEWGHYFEGKMSRSDSPAGDHQFGTTKDPRLAWGEGWATALSGIVLYPNTRYVDTGGQGQRLSGITMDIEDNLESDANPGWFSETSVMHVFYDLWDPKNEPFDLVSLPLGALYDVMVGAQKNTPAFTTVFSFVAALRKANSLEEPAIDALLAHRGVATKITNAWAEGQTNSGGVTGALPVYVGLAINATDPTTLRFTSVGTSEIKLNELGTNRFCKFSGTGAEVSIRAKFPEKHGVRVAVYKSGVYMDRSGVLNGEGEVTPEVTISGFETIAGTDYTVLVTSTSDQAGETYTGTVIVTSP